MPQAPTAHPRPAMRPLLTAFLVALALQPLEAQDVFVAPSARTVIAFTEQSNSEDPSHTLYISNNSTVPIVVFGITLSSCENVKQSCGSRPTKIKIGAGRRVNVGRVQARDSEQGFGYRWNFSYHADSADAKAMAVLREHGIELDPAAAARRAAAEAASVAQASVEPAGAARAEDGATAPGERLSVWRASPPAPRPPSRTLRMKLGWGSILGSTMVPDKPVLATGPCVDPAQSAKYEQDATIEKTPWRPARIDRSFAETRLPPEIRDSLMQASQVNTFPELLVRFVADTTGTIIPESVSVLESPHGQLSARVCTAVFSAYVEPAKNRDGRAVSSWVQTPVRVLP